MVSPEFFSLRSPALRPFRLAPGEKPRRDDRSAGPSIDPAYFMNAGTEFLRFAIALNPLALRLYHRPIGKWISPAKSVPCLRPPASISTKTPKAKLSMYA